MKILILKPSSLGDVIQALPVLRLLKLHLPQSRIYWWIDSRLAPLLDGDPDLAGLVLFDRRRWAAPRNWGELAKSMVWMRDQRFDWVIDLQGLARSGAISWLANGQLLVGLDEPREGARGYYDIVVRRRSWHTHAVDWYLGVLSALQVPTARSFDWLPSHPEVTRALCRDFPLEGHRWILLQPGARWMNKRWPIGHFVDLVRLTRARFPQFRIAILGGADDVALGASIAGVDRDHCLDLTGRLSLQQMVEWIRVGEVLVTNDTGPMHVAAGLGVPVVALFGPTEPCRTGPYGQLNHVLRSSISCVPCMRARCTWANKLECLSSISPHRVLQEIETRLAHAR